MEIERSLPHIHLTYEELLLLVRKAFPSCKKIDHWEILTGGAVNTSYKLQIESHCFVLRLYVRERSHCKTEQAIHQLIDTTVSTPKLIYADELHEPWAFAIFEFIPGLHLSQISQEQKTPLSYQLGALLASIHSFKFPEAGLFGEGTAIKVPFEKGSSPYLEETRSVLSHGIHIKKRLGNQLTQDALAFIEANRHFFPIVHDDACLTHADFKPANLLYHDEKPFILDWEFAHAGLGILDFAILLRHRDQFPLDLTALEKGYCDHGGELPKDWIPSALITDFVNIVTLLEEPSERPQLFQQLTSILQQTITLPYFRT